MKEMSLLDLVTLVSALGCGVIGGAFFAFSAFVMKALGKLPPAEGIAAMQSINLVVVNPVFLTPFVGTAVAGLVLGVTALLRWHDPRASLWLAGGVLYVAGTFLVTGLFNVPLNNRLAGVVPSSPEAATLWLAYLSRWTAWNHVRTIAALAAAASLTLAWRLRP
jgi:uncharacterized membrane protein